jgi:hypothetical protein
MQILGSRSATQSSTHICALIEEHATDSWRLHFESSCRAGATACHQGAWSEHYRRWRSLRSGTLSLLIPMHFLTPCMRCSTFKAQNVANTLWAYAIFVCEPGAGLMRELDGRAEALADTFNAQDVSQTS